MTADRATPSRADLVSWVYGIQGALGVPSVGGLALVMLGWPRLMVRREYEGLAGCHEGLGVYGETSVEVVAFLGQRIAQTYVRPSMALCSALTAEGEMLVVRALFEPWRGGAMRALSWAQNAAVTRGARRGAVTRGTIAGVRGGQGLSLLSECCDPGWPLRGCEVGIVTEGQLMHFPKDEPRSAVDPDGWMALNLLLRREGVGPRSAWQTWAQGWVCEAVAGDSVVGQRVVVGVAGGAATTEGVAVALLGIQCEGSVDVIGGVGATGAVWPLGGAWARDVLTEAPWVGGTTSGSATWIGGEQRLRRLQSMLG